MKALHNDFFEVTETMTYNTCLSRSADWARNLVANEYAITNGSGLIKFFGALSNKPAIIVGAGPSLDKNVDLLRDCQDRACIICVDAAHKTLTSKKIEPHFVFAVDAEPVVKKYIDYDKYKNTILACCSIIHPSVYEDWRGKLFWFNSKPSKSEPLTTALIEFTGQIGDLSSCGSVSTLAFSFALGLGCDPIILVGMDSAYLNKDKHHSSNSPATSFEEYKEIEEIDINGEKCYTNVALFSFACWFEKAMSSYQGKTYINATEGGIISRGCILMSLKQAIEKFLLAKIDVFKLLFSNEKMIDMAKDENRWKFGNGSSIKQHQTYFPSDFIRALIMAYKEANPDVN